MARSVAYTTMHLLNSMMQFCFRRWQMEGYDKKARMEPVSISLQINKHGIEQIQKLNKNTNKKKNKNEKETRKRHK
jgi:hypothetical protein